MRSSHHQHRPRIFNASPKATFSVRPSGCIGAHTKPVPTPPHPFRGSHLGLDWIAFLLYDKVEGETVSISHVTSDVTHGELYERDGLPAELEKRMIRR